MWLLLVYISVVVAGETLAYLIGSYVEAAFTPTVGLPVFLAMFFSVLAFGWPVAVRLTSPTGRWNQ